MKRIKSIIFGTGVMTLTLFVVIGWLMAIMHIDRMIEHRTAISVCAEYLGNDVPHALAIVSTAEYHRFDYKMSLAIIMQESHGRIFASSQAGARGLMALMMPTMKYMADKKDYPAPRTKWDVYDVANNVFYGTWIARDNLAYYGRNLGLEIYNVGSGNYYRKGWRNPDYVADVLYNYSLVKSKHDIARKKVVRNIIRDIRDFI